MGLLIAGILAVATGASVVFSNQMVLTATATSSTQQQSAFITSTTSLGDVTITEILVNTIVQFPTAGRSSPWPPYDFEVAGLLVLLCLSALVVGLSFSDKT